MPNFTKLDGSPSDWPSKGAWMDDDECGLPDDKEDAKNTQNKPVFDRRRENKLNKQTAMKSRRKDIKRRLNDANKDENNDKNETLS